MPALEMSVPAGAATRASWLVALASTALLGAGPCADSVSRGALSDCSPAACNAASLAHRQSLIALEAQAPSRCTEKSSDLLSYDWRQPYCCFSALTLQRVEEPLWFQVSKIPITVPKAAMLSARLQASGDGQQSCMCAVACSPVWRCPRPALQLPQRPQHS